MENKYTILSSKYDFFFDSDMTEYVFNKQKSVINSLIKKTDIKILEVGAGTGRVTEYLCQMGTVTAIDSSVEMLSLLQEKSNNFKSRPIIYQADILNFTISKKYDLIIMCLDVFNYIKPSLVKSLYEKVYNLLNNGGIFVYDFSSRYKLETELGNNVIAHDFDDFSFIWTNMFNKQKDYLEFDFCLYEKVKENLYKKSVESHIQYVHDIEVVKEQGLNYFDEVYVYVDSAKDECSFSDMHIENADIKERYYVYLKKVE